MKKFTAVYRFATSSIGAINGATLNVLVDAIDVQHAHEQIQTNLSQDTFTATGVDAPGHSYVIRSSSVFFVDVLEEKYTKSS